MLIALELFLNHYNKKLKTNQMHTKLIMIGLVLLTSCQSTRKTLHSQPFVKTTSGFAKAGKATPCKILLGDTVNMLIWIKNK